MQLHLIPNAHLDPVWQWDWREGLNEGLTWLGQDIKLDTVSRRDVVKRILRARRTNRRL